MLSPKQQLLAYLLFPLIISATPAFAQKRPAPPRTAPAPVVAEPVISFDTLLADEQYRVYSEVRNVGTLIRSQGFNDLLEPLVQFAEPPPQFSTVLNWIKNLGDLLAGSRLCVASWPSKNALPQFVMAIELASPADAKRLEADLRALVPKLEPKPSPSASPQSPQPKVEPPPNPGMLGQLQIQQAGAVVLLSDKKISLADLKPPRRRLLAENPNFVMTRSRFASEPIFAYIDFKAIEKEELKQRQKWEREARIREEREAANPTPEPTSDPTLTRQAPDTDFEVPPPLEDAPPNEGIAVPSDADMQLANSFSQAFYPLSMALFGGRAKYPEALGVALAFEGDSYTVRGLLVNNPENRSLPLPFIPQLASGPPLTPSSPGVLPADVDLAVVLSLDYPQIHDGMLRAFAEQPWISVMGVGGTRRPASPFSTFEEKAGINVKEELLPLLGNELAVVLTKPQAVEPSTPADVDNEDVRSVRMPELLPVIAVSVKDRERVKKVILKMFESMGMKAAATLAHTEKRGDAEIISYGNFLSYAFVGDFLIFGPDPGLTKRAVDSYLSSDTLSSSSKFRNAVRWQGRQLQGQIYLTPELVERYIFAGKDKPQLTVPANQPIEPLTYMLTNDGIGPVHEAHVPRSLVQMVVSGLTTKANESPIFTNESIAKNMLRTMAAAQAAFRKASGNGRYATIDEMAAQGLIPKDLTEKYGYKVELTVLSNRFEITATPIEYGRTGKRSFYIDETEILRGGDHGGGAATLSDKPINE